MPTSHGSLGTFVRDQRTFHKLLLEGKSVKGMTQERTNQLEALGFKWSIKATSHSCNNRMEQLREYKNEHGHLNVPAHNGSVGSFLKNQRTLHKLLREGKPAKGKTRERENQLKALGFKW